MTYATPLMGKRIRNLFTKKEFIVMEKYRDMRGDFYLLWDVEKNRFSYAFGASFPESFEIVEQETLGA